MRYSIHNINILRTRNLCDGDRVDFGGWADQSLKYIVTSNFLKGDGFASNRRIFEFLDIADRGAFAAGYYGYDAAYGDWPEFRHRDYAACTRLVARLLVMSIEREYTLSRPAVPRQQAPADTYRPEDLMF